MDESTGYHSTSIQVKHKEHKIEEHRGFPAPLPLSPFTLLIWTGGSTPLLCLEGVPDLPVAPQDEQWEYMSNELISHLYFKKQVLNCIILEISKTPKFYTSANHSKHKSMYIYNSIKLF